MVAKTKSELLAKYADREPQAFIQFDAFDDLGADSVVRLDKDGHTVFSHVTYELMHGCAVRVFVRPTTEPQTAVKMLKKITKAIEEHGYSDHLREIAEPEPKNAVMKS